MFEIQSFSYRYPTQKQAAISDISLSFNEGEVVLLAGPNGGGKSTLLKAMIGVVPKAYGGEISGSVSFKGQVVSKLTIRELAENVGVVLQDPERQVTHMTVQEELEFGPSNLLLPREEVLDRVRQARLSIGLSDLENVEILTLSGGELQRLSIASMLTMKPKVLILDEPITNLDPFGVMTVVEALRKLKGYIDCIVIASHWIDPFLDLITRVVVISEGKVVGDMRVNDILANVDLLVRNKVEIPERMRLSSVYKLLGQKAGMSIRLGADTVDQSIVGSSVVECRDVSLTFSNKREILRQISFVLLHGQRYVLAGRNGTGKSTLARLLLGLIKPSSGVLKRNYYTAGLAPQKPSLGFLGSTVLEEMSLGISASRSEIEEVLDFFGLTAFLNDSPHVLSGGLQRRLSLATNFVRNPELMVLDEPTAGLDGQGVKDFLMALDRFSGTVLHITHDMRIVSQSDTNLLVVGATGLDSLGSRNLMTGMHMQELGYDLISETIALAIKLNAHTIPMKPEEVEVYDADIV